MIELSMHVDNWRHFDVLYDVPEKGQMFPLVEVGTHCRGSIFLDGNHLLTHELESAIDQISRSFEGFYFGRYDIRCPSVEDLKKGINFNEEIGNCAPYKSDTDPVVHE